MSTYLTEHFTLEEMTHSDTAVACGIDNAPPPPVVEELTKTCQMLEIVRAALGKPVHVSSGYRCPSLNAQIGGVPDSQHQFGQAADIVMPEFGSARAVFDAIRTLDPPFAYDQLIIEKDSHGHEWVHISQSPQARQQAMYIGPDGHAQTVA